jgi:YebC/PmpR family DNA-binding regulatory protein
MSGHSKWATIHRQKGIKDAARGQVFSKFAQAITIAAKTGGPNPDTNFKLRVIIDKARASNMPKDNIDRALSKGAEAGNLEEVTYEAFAPSGVQLMIDAATDNRNRTGQEIKNMIERAGGRFAGPGSVAFNFEPKGYIFAKKNQTPSEDQMLQLIDAGVEDIEESDDGFDIYVPPQELFSAKRQIEELGFEIETTELIQKPKMKQDIQDEGEAQKVITFIEALEEHADVQKVYSNLQ